MVDEGRRVYVHLPYEYDAALWPQLYNAGRVADKTPYGYHHAEEWGYHVTFAESHEESKNVSLFRRATKRALGFDLWHAWRNRKRMRGAEVIWTFTEKEYLAIILLRRCRLSSTDTLLVAHSLWLFDLWEEFPRWRRSLYRWLIQNDMRTILTVLSEPTLEAARSMFPTMRSELLHYGIPSDSFPLRSPAFTYGDQGTRSLRILSPGNDMHRDWGTLIEVVKGNQDLELLIAADVTQRQNRSLKRYMGTSDRIVIEHLKSVDEIRNAYAWADIVVVPLVPNKHASGFQVIAEAVSAGRPVIASDTGGLRGYFDDSEICYVPPGDVEKLAAAIRECATEVGYTLLRARNAQAKFLAADLTTRGYASRHVALTEELLSSWT